MKLVRDNKEITGLVLFVLVSGAFITSGFAGIRVVIGILVLMFLPFYLIFNNFRLDEKEKIVFAFFVGITLFPSFVYFLGFIMSFRLAILVVFLALMLLAFLLHKYKKS